LLSTQSVAAEAGNAAGEDQAVQTKGITAAPLEAEILDPEVALARHRQAWAALAAVAEGANAYALPCAFDAWRRTVAAGMEPTVLVACRGGELVGVMPIMRAAVRRGPSFSPRHDFAPADRAFLRTGGLRPFRVRQISPVVSVAAMMTVPAPLVRAADRPQVVGAMAARLAGLAGWDVLVAPVAEAAQGDWIEGLRRAGLDPRVHPLHRVVMGLAHVEPFDAIVGRQNKKYRQNVRRARAEAERIGLALEVHEGAAAAARLDELAAVAAASWKARPGEDVEITVPYDGAQRRFYEALVGGPGLFADGATPLVAVARVDGAAVAAILAIRCGDRMTACVTFHAAIFPKASAGLLVLGRTIDWAAEQGLARYDLNGTHEWIRHLVDEGRGFDNVIAFAPTLRGRGFGLVRRAIAALR